MNETPKNYAEAGNVVPNCDFEKISTTRESEIQTTGKGTKACSLIVIVLFLGTTAVFLASALGYAVIPELVTFAICMVYALMAICVLRTVLFSAMYVLCNIILTSLKKDPEMYWRENYDSGKKFVDSRDKIDRPWLVAFRFFWKIVQIALIGSLIMIGHPILAAIFALVLLSSHISMFLVMNQIRQFSSSFESYRDNEIQVILAKKG
jgi:hypothetical protein